MLHRQRLPPAAAPAAEVVANERASFEAWFCSGGDYEPEWLDKSGANHALYLHADTENMWQAWQARSAFAVPAAGQERAVAVAKLRHVYENLINGGVRDTASAKRIAVGLLGPAIQVLESLAAPGAAIDAREQEAKDRAVWAKLAAKAHGWTDDSTPPMVDGRFETGWHESEFQVFMQGVRHGRS